MHYLSRETFLSSLELAREVLLGLALRPINAGHAVCTFKAYDERLLTESFQLHDDEDRMIA